MQDERTHETQRGEETILLVSPEPETRALAAFMLARLGYRVLEAHHALEALQIYDDHVGLIDLLLVEAVISRVNGHALAQTLRSSNDRLRVLYLADSAYERMSRKMAARKQLHFLVRPFTMAQLSSKLREALGSPAAHIQKATA